MITISTYSVYISVILYLTTLFIDRVSFGDPEVEKLNFNKTISVRETLYENRTRANYN